MLQKRVRRGGFVLGLALFCALLCFVERGSAQEPHFKRGDTNADGTLNVADAVYLLTYLFVDGDPPTCFDTADTTDDGSVDIGDAVTMLSYLFEAGWTFPGDEPSSELPPPFSDCGPDPTPDSLDCYLYPPCGTFPPPPAAPVLDPYPSLVLDPMVTISGAAPDATVVRIISPVMCLWVPVIGGTFIAADIPLTVDSVNSLFFTGINEEFGFESAVSTAIVTNDMEAPNVFIDFPLDGDTVSVGTTDVAGRVGDMLSGFDGLTVTVNGVEAVVDIGIGTNGTFFLPSVPLDLTSPPSPTVIEAIATDSLGNTAMTQIEVTRVPPSGPQLTMVSGNAQSGAIHEILPNPIVVRVTTVTGQPIESKLVTFHVDRSDGRLGSDAASTTLITYQTFTDADGLAMAAWKLGSDAGCGNNRVEVITAGATDSVYFCASATPGPAAQINVGTGNNQKVEIGNPAPAPLRVFVSDGCNGVEGVAVTFTVLSGGGLVDGETEVTIPTLDTGHCEVAFHAGLAAGPQYVRADFVGNLFGPATFVITGVVRDESMPTSFQGLVFDNSRQPIGGAMVLLTVAGIESRTVVTESDGSFSISNIEESGPAKLHVNGLTATQLSGATIPEGTFPRLTYDVVVVPNAVNELPTPVLLPRLNPANWVLFDNTTDVELTCASLEGLVFTVFAGSMTRADGTIPSPADPEPIGVHPVHHDDIPMPMPDGAAPPFAWTFQPGGADFDPPVAVQYPNLTGLPAGAIAYFLSFNHDTSRFEIVATGHVTDTAECIVTDPGVGISHAGWGCNCPPYSVTADCETCNVEITGPDYACPDDECTFTAAGDPSGGTYSWSGGTAVGGTTSATYTATFAAKGDQMVTCVYTCDTDPVTTSTKTHTVKVENPTKAKTFTKSRHPDLASPQNYATLFSSGADLMRSDDDGPGDGGTTDDVCLDCTFTINDATEATFPDQSAATFPAAQRYDYTLATYNDVPNDTVGNQLRAATFADLKLTNSGHDYTGWASTATDSIIFTESANAATTVHEWGHIAGSGLSHRGDSKAIMYGSSSTTKNEINTTERAQYLAD